MATHTTTYMIIIQDTKVMYESAVIFLGIEPRKENKATPPVKYIVILFAYSP